MKQLEKQPLALIEGENSLIANLSSFLKNEFLKVIWVGFYLKDKDFLVLELFQGRVARARTTKGKEVCSQAFAIQSVLYAQSFEVHIDCDSRTQSELATRLSVKRRLAFWVLIAQRKIALSKMKLRL